MFVSFSEMPDAVQDRWNAKAAKGIQKDWALLKTLIFENTFPTGNLNSILEASEATALQLYEFRGGPSRHFDKGSVRSWHQRNQDQSPWETIAESLELAIADGVFDHEDSSRAALLAFLKLRIEKNQELSNAKLAEDLNIGDERVGQLLAEIGKQLLEKDYIRFDDLRQRGILLTPRLRKTAGTELRKKKPVAKADAPTDEVAKDDTEEHGRG